MNEIINKFLSAEDKFIPQMHLKQPEFTYSACGPFTKNKERIQKFKETGDSKYILKTSQIYLEFNMTWLIEILRIYIEEQSWIKYYVIKHLIQLKTPNMMDINVDLLQWFISFLIIKTYNKKKGT